MKYKIGKTTLERLKNVDRKLVILFTTYLMLGKKDIGVTYGARTEGEQKDLKAKGKSQVSKSKHLPMNEKGITSGGNEFEYSEINAIDIIAFKDGKMVWDRAYYDDIIKDMKDIVAFYGWDDINFGYDFKTLNDCYHISVREDGDGGIK